MKISTQTGGIEEFIGQEKCMEMLAQAGFDAVDFNIDHMLSYGAITRCEHSEIIDLPDDQILEYWRPSKETAEKYGITFGQAHAPFPSCSKNPEYQEYLLEVMRKCLLICEYVNCPYLVIHPNFYGYDERLTRQEEWDANIRFYSALIPWIRKYGVKVCLENMFYGYQGKLYTAICGRMQEAIAYIDALNDIAGEKLFGFCYDSGHALIAGNDPCDDLVALGDRVWTLHLHDNNGSNDQHVAPYWGVLDWDGLCRGLREIGYKGTINFETFHSVVAVDPAMVPVTLQYIAQAGRVFAAKIEG